MKSLWLVLFVLLICQSLAEKKRYDGYKVLRVNIANFTKYDIDNFFLLTEKHLIDVWATNIQESWVDVMLAPEQLQLLDNFNTKVQIENVQTSIDEIEAERASIIPNDIFDDFPTSTEVRGWLEDQAGQHSNVASMFRLGNTAQGREILGIRLGYSTSLPMIFLHCTIHAREWITTTTCLWIIDNLLNTDEGHDLLQKFQFHVVPILNVDGYEYAHNSERMWRKNRATNPGSSCVGTDLNRNYAYAFGGGGSSPNPCADTYRGPTAFSAPETSSQNNYLRPYMNSGLLRAFVDIHAYGGQWMSPWGYTTTLPPDFDEMLISMQSIQTAVRSVNGRTYQIGSSARVIYIAAGGSDDWAYGDGGVVHSFTVECYGSSFTAPISAIRPTGREIYEGVKRLANDFISTE